MAEKQIADVEVITINIMEGQHKTPDYLAKAGLANVPMLEMDDGACITESIAICRYLESRYPEPNLFGRTPEETAEIEMWMRRAEMLVAMPVMIGVRHTHPAMAALEQQIPEMGRRNLESAARAMKMLDRRLSDRTWLASDRLTIADIVAFVGVDFGRMIRLQPPEDLIHLCRWAETMRSRPAAAAGMSRQAA